jgi:hypothetical protein
MAFTTRPPYYGRARHRLAAEAAHPAVLTGVFLGVVLASLLVARAAAEALAPDPSASRSVLRSLNYTPTQRARVGHVPTPLAQPVPTNVSAGAAVAAGAGTAPDSSTVATVQAPVSQAAPTAVAAPAHDAGERLRVAHTDGQGVILRSAPRLDARQPRGLMDGMQVTVLQRSGAEWVYVRADNGQQGWVPSQYLAAR